jgi:hypothetical protein
MLTFEEFFGIPVLPGRVNYESHTNQGRRIELVEIKATLSTGS